jgi:hypothetical protein
MAQGDDLEQAAHLGLVAETAAGGGDGLRLLRVARGEGGRARTYSERFEPAALRDDAADRAGARRPPRAAAAASRAGEVSRIGPSTVKAKRVPS